MLQVEGLRQIHFALGSREKTIPGQDGQPPKGPEVADSRSFPVLSRHPSFRETIEDPTDARNGSFFEKKHDLLSRMEKESAPRLTCVLGLTPNPSVRTGGLGSEAAPFTPIRLQRGKLSPWTLLGMLL